MPPRNARKNGSAGSERSALYAIAVGRARIFTIVAALVDTNVLVYRFDSRDRVKQSRAVEVLRRGIAGDSIRIAHQAVVEFHAAVSRPLGGHGSLLGAADARRETEELLSQFAVVYPNDAVVRTALRGMPAYQLPWFDALMWAHAEEHGLNELISEDFQHDRMYGSVRVVNPFL